LEKNPELEQIHRITGSIVKLLKYELNEKSLIIHDFEFFSSKASPMFGNPVEIDEKEISQNFFEIDESCLNDVVGQWEKNINESVDLEDCKIGMFQYNMIKELKEGPIRTDGNVFYELVDLEEFEISKIQDIGSQNNEKDLLEMISMQTNEIVPLTKTNEYSRLIN
jgi:hypothetical protein